MGTVPTGTGELRMIHSRVVWMSAPVDRSITVSAPDRGPAVVAPRGPAALVLLDVAPLEDPVATQRRQARFGLGAGTARVVQPERRFAAVEIDLGERDPHRARPVDVHLAPSTRDL